MGSSCTHLTVYTVQEVTPKRAILLPDDTRQFRLITPWHALCWIHEGRHYKKLSPILPSHRQKLDNFPDEFWTYYRECLTVHQHPLPADKDRLHTRLNKLFSMSTGYNLLDQRIAKTKSHAEKLLLVLNFPQLPLHNNPSELGTRRRVREHNMSLGPRTHDGLLAWDTFMTSAETAKKLGVRFFAYLYGRISRTYTLPSLAQLIPQEAAASLSL